VEHQGGIDGLGDSLAGSLNQGAKVVEELAGNSGANRVPGGWNQLLG
jgi:hypothetical protein